MNPSCYAVTEDNADAIVRCAECVPLEMQGTCITPVADFPSRQKALDDIKNALQHFGTLFMSYYRPGAYWEDPVFVCPRCAHATKEEFATQNDSWYCKYCYSTWKCDKERGLYLVQNQ